MVRVVFMGTPEFAVPALEGLARECEVAMVVTQRDRPSGRGRRLQPPPVKEAAQRLGLPLWQPRTLRSPDMVARLRGLAPDLVAVVAYGHILRPEVLAIPPGGCVNVHASLLPQYRGPEPIAAAILSGEDQTGVTIMLIDEGVDTGPILAQRAIPIAADDTRASLAEKLAQMGADLLLETLGPWLQGEILPQPQNDAAASYAPELKKADGEIDWSQSATSIERMTRAYDPWPGAYTYWQGTQLKIRRARPMRRQAGEVGTVVAVEAGVAVTARDGALLLEELQLAGRRSMRAADFVRGRRDFLGSHLPS